MKIFFQYPFRVIKKRFSSIIVSIRDGTGDGFADWVLVFGLSSRKDTPPAVPIDWLEPFATVPTHRAH